MASLLNKDSYSTVKIQTILFTVFLGKIPRILSIWTFFSFVYKSHGMPLNNRIRYPSHTRKLKFLQYLLRLSRFPTSSSSMEMRNTNTESSVHLGFGDEHQLFLCYKNMRRVFFIHLATVVEVKHSTWNESDWHNLVLLHHSNLTKWAKNRAHGKHSSSRVD